MVFVAVAAINFAAVRAMMANPGPVSEALAIGAMPMASVLVMAFLAGRRRPGRHQFLLGFVAFGTMALTIYIVLAVCFHDSTVDPYVRPFIAPVVQIIGRERLVIYIPIAYSIAVAVLVLPQLAFALLGGFLWQRYRILIVRR